MEPKLIGRHIVTDPGICHGKPTFRGTRILVSDVLDQIADGMAWETVIQEWHESITREAIAEALQLATRALLDPSAGMQFWRLHEPREVFLSWSV